MNKTERNTTISAAIAEVVVIKNMHVFLMTPALIREVIRKREGKLAGITPHQIAMALEAYAREQKSLAYWCQYMNGQYRVTILPSYRELPPVGIHGNGFSWGYMGSGPAELSLSILAHHLEETPLSIRRYYWGKINQNRFSLAWNIHHDFKVATTALWPQERDVTIGTREIAEIVAKICEPNPAYGGKRG